MMPPEAGCDVAAVLLAGGQSRRMGGGDKCLRSLGGRPLLAHVVERIAPQVDHLFLNANGDPSRFAGFDLPVVADVVPDFAGPLAGILTGLEWARDHVSGCCWLVSVPTDCPFLPRDLVARLRAAVSGGARLASVTSGGQTHPVVGLWPLDIAADLRHALIDEGEHKIDRFTARYAVRLVDWPAVAIDPFFNANRPEDMAAAERLLVG